MEHGSDVRANLQDSHSSALWPPKKLHFTISAKGIKITGHNHWLAPIGDNTMEVFKLLLPVFKGQNQP